MNKAIMATVVMALVAGQAFAATPKTESFVTRDKITLGDVFDDVTANADYYLAPAPAAGKATVLNAGDLSRIAEAFHLGWKPQTNLEQVVVRRAAAEASPQVVGAADIQAALQEPLAEKMKGQKFDTELFDQTVSLRVPKTADKTVNVESLVYDAAQGTFKATVSAQAAPGVKKEIKGRLYPLVQVPVLKSALRPGEVISAADIDTVGMRRGNISPNVLTDAGKLIGRTPKHGLPAMRPVAAGDVQAPLLIKKGDLVTMELKSGVISLTAKGRALDSGAEGEAIRIMNTNSKQVVDAVVTGTQTAVVKL